MSLILSLRLEILVFAGSERENEGPMVGWIFTEIDLVLSFLLLLLVLPLDAEGPLLLLALELVGGVAIVLPYVLVSLREFLLCLLFTLLSL